MKFYAPLVALLLCSAFMGTQLHAAASKKLAVETLVPTPVQANPSCSDTLGQNHSNDAFSWHIDHDRFDHEIDHAGAALAVIQIIAGDTGCDPKTVRYEVSEESSAGCKQLIPGNNLSQVCFVETNFGYFVVSETLPNGIAVTWSRWD